jgi:glucose/mannose-6-phosphate isomerase
VIHLDDLDGLRAGDPGDMLRRIEELPAQLQTAWATIQDVDFPDAYRNARTVVIAGMGGSAIGGSLVTALAEGESAVPVAVNRAYHLPAYVDEDALIIASSYSGTTEETLSAVEEALQAGAMVIGVTTGGRLAELARDRGFPVVVFDYDAAPRAALGHSFGLLLGLLDRLGFVESKAADVTEAVDVLQRLQRVIGPAVPKTRNPAKDIAEQLTGRIPIVYGAGIMIPVARRWKGQFNENAKTMAAYDELPELNHNSVEGYRYPASLQANTFVVMLRSALDSSAIQARFDVTAGLLHDADLPHASVTAWGDTATGQMLSAIHFGDFVSFYLAALNGVDATPVDKIRHLKRELKRVTQRG